MSRDTAITVQAQVTDIQLFRASNIVSVVKPVYCRNTRLKPLILRDETMNFY